MDRAKEKKFTQINTENASRVYKRHRRGQRGHGGKHPIGPGVEKVNAESKPQGSANKEVKRFDRKVYWTSNTGISEQESVSYRTRDENEDRRGRERGEDR